MRLRDWLADGVAHVFEAGLGFGLVSRAADILVACLVNRLADVVTDCSVTSLINRFAHGIAAVTVAGLIARLANSASHVAVACLIDRLADVVSAGLVAGRIDRLANRVALITVACFVNVLGAGDRDRLSALIVHSLHAGILLRLPNRFLNHLTLRAVTAPSCYKIPAW